jgi:hypothetical protein
VAAWAATSGYPKDKRISSQRNFSSKELKAGKGKVTYDEGRPMQQTNAGSPSPTKYSFCIFWRDFRR